MKQSKFRITIVFVYIFSLSIIPSCKKATVNTIPMSSLTITNAIVGGATIKLGSSLLSVASNSFAQFGLLAGDNELYVWPVGDSAHPYFIYPKLEAEESQLYSLFLSGQVNTGVEGILIKEELPLHTDSSCSVRIINLSPNSPPLNITLSTSTTTIEVSNLVYKQYTNFKTYVATANKLTYIFQIRKASDNTLLTSYTLNTPLMANVTLVIRGLVGTTPALGVTRVNHDR